VCDSGTTAAVVVVKDNDIIIGNVGDTEIVVAVGASLRLTAHTRV
jgi:serine/threonine protein phosphatase PrpC